MKDSVVPIFLIIAFVGIFLGMMLISYDNGVHCALFKKLRCKFGWHKRKVFKIRKYYCHYCKKPRDHPELKAVDGGKKISDNWYKF